MDKYIEELFERAQPFDEGELYQSQEYTRCNNITLDLEKQMGQFYGEEAQKLLNRFLEAYFEVERFACLHYFYQGYLVAKAEQEKTP